MAWRGRKALGSFLTLSVLTTDSAGSPVEPDEAPLALVLGSSGLVLSKRLPPAERAQVVGYFQYGLFLGESFSAGHYEVVYQWRASGAAGAEVDYFAVIEGGDPGGSVISMHYYERPGARFLVQQLDSGRLVVGKNPYVGPAPLGG